MRMLMKVGMKVESANKAVEDGTMPKTVMAFVEQFRPEACYFIAEGGRRMGYFFFDLKEPSDIPSAAEPFFMKLGASIEFTPAMTLEDMKAGIGKFMGGV